MTHIAVVIPCFRVKSSILDVISKVGEEVTSIYVVDDCCPDKTGDHVMEFCSDLRVRVLRQDSNTGVGGAVIAGYRKALIEGADIIVKIDGDGQMDPMLIPMFCNPIIEGLADYVKGNRFFELESLQAMPKVRLVGNALLSFLNKFVSGYWNIMDPTNGFVVIHATVLSYLPLNKIDKGYFFESDMLFRLGTLRAKVMDVPMVSRYGNEISSLSVSRVVADFPFKYIKRIMKRIAYNYFLRDFNIASLELIGAILFLFFGVTFGASAWIDSMVSGVYASSGTVMLAALPLFMSFLLFLGFINYDVSNQPRLPLHKVLMGKKY